MPGDIAMSLATRTASSESIRKGRMQHQHSFAAILAAWCAKFLCMSLICLSLSAQTDRSSLNGTVTDPSGAVIQGVVVTAISETTGLRRETTTSGAGKYEIHALLVGKY